MKKECTIIFITATIVTIGLGLGVGAGPGGAAAGAGCPVAGVGAGVGAGSGGCFQYFEALNLLWIPQYSYSKVRTAMLPTTSVVDSVSSLLNLDANDF